MEASEEKGVRASDLLSLFFFHFPFSVLSFLFLFAFALPSLPQESVTQGRKGEKGASRQNRIYQPNETAAGKQAASRKRKLSVEKSDEEREKEKKRKTKKPGI